ncbi:MAG: L,D-transpeptidase family protein, partial [Chloroflexi bacterium]|nr:L,D-transpeptidase family protein [Chloroflexota bacterium]
AAALAPDPLGPTAARPPFSTAWPGGAEPFLQLILLGAVLLLGLAALAGWDGMNDQGLQPPVVLAAAVETNADVGALQEALAAPAVEPPLAPEIVIPARPMLTDAERAEGILRDLDTVWADEDWERAAPLAAQALAFRPDDPELKQKLMAAYFYQGVAYLDQDEPERALAKFDKALEAQPGEPQVIAEREALVAYLAGRNFYLQRDWVSAIQSLRKVYAAYAGYLDTRDLLYRATYEQGLALKQNKDLAGALKAFQAAIDIDANAVEARGEWAQVKAALAAPLPTASAAATGNKWIDINLATQRFRAYQGQQLIYDFVTSTGEPARPTQPGQYTVLDKIPNAYSVFWNLWMPNWLGIYWAGTSENGIHALPILSNGQTLWSGYLGRRVSFGCVILDTSAARLIYNWAEIGTPVNIHY